MRLQQETDLRRFRKQRDHVSRVTRMSTGARRTWVVGWENPGMRSHVIWENTKKMNVMALRKIGTWYMFMTNYLVVGRKRGIRSGFWLESGRTNIVKLQRMCWGQDYKFGFEKGFPKVPRKWVCGNSMEISPRIKTGSELWIQDWEPFV